MLSLVDWILNLIRLGWALPGIWYLDDFAYYGNLGRLAWRFHLRISRAKTADKLGLLHLSCLFLDVLRRELVLSVPIEVSFSKNMVTRKSTLVSLVLAVRCDSSQNSLRHIILAAHRLETSSRNYCTFFSGHLLFLKSKFRGVRAAAWLPLWLISIESVCCVFSAAEAMTNCVAIVHLRNNVGGALEGQDGVGRLECGEISIE